MTLLYVIGTAPLVGAFVLRAVLMIRARRREPRVAVLESSGPREAVQRAMRRD